MNLLQVFFFVFLLAKFPLVLEDRDSAKICFKFLPRKPHPRSACSHRMTVTETKVPRDHLKGGETYHKRTWEQKFIVCIFITGKNWRQSKCPSTGEQINKVWYVYTLEHDSATKQYKLLLHAQREWASKTSCERLHSVWPHVWVQEQANYPMVMDSRVAAWEKGKGGDKVLTAEGHEGTFWSDGNVPHIDLSGCHSGKHILKIHQAVLFRCVHFTIYKLHLTLKI